MSLHEQPDLRRARAAATIRDAAVRRMSRINRLVAGGAALMVAVFATLAAQASAPGATSTTTTPTTTSTPTTAGTSSSGSYGWQASDTQSTATAAPAPTQQAPVVTSGGS
jgi:hypothetical protein